MTFDTPTPFTPGADLVECPDDSTLRPPVHRLDLGRRRFLSDRFCIWKRIVRAEFTLEGRIVLECYS